jgi:hypothetical protein
MESKLKSVEVTGITNDTGAIVPVPSLSDSRCKGMVQESVLQVFGRLAYACMSEAGVTGLLLPESGLFWNITLIVFQSCCLVIFLALFMFCS